MVILDPGEPPGDAILIQVPDGFRIHNITQVGGVPLGKVAVKLTPTLVPTVAVAGGDVFQPSARADVKGIIAKIKAASGANSLAGITDRGLRPSRI